MRRTHGFALLLTSIVSATALACGGTASGDGGETTLGPVSPAPTVAPGFTPVPSRSLVQAFEQLPASPRFDGAVMRLVMAGPGGDPAALCSAVKPHARILSTKTIGAPCAKAADGAKCADELACIVSDAGMGSTSGGQVPAHYLFVFGKDGALTTVTTRPELLTWLGAIDVADKAIFLVAFDKGSRVTATGYRAAASGGFDIQIRGGGACAGEPRFDAIIHVSVDGVLTEIEKRVDTEPTPACAEGRRPAGLVGGPRGGIGAGVAEYLAEAAHLEAAAVVAFEQMATLLRAAGAPTRFVDAALDARADEIRHARSMGALARAYGAQPVEPTLNDPGELTLEALALDNAVEGCVRETYAALRAMWQAEHASDPRIRAALAVIAREESRHAELSWALDAWLHERLDATARARVADARRRALCELREELHGTPHHEVVRVAGMPTARVALALFDRLADQFEAPVAA
jgi:hypothetical protein